VYQGILELEGGRGVAQGETTDAMANTLRFLGEFIMLVVGDVVKVDCFAYLSFSKTIQKT